MFRKRALPRICNIAAPVVDDPPAPVELPAASEPATPDALTAASDPPAPDAPSSGRCLLDSDLAPPPTRLSKTQVSSALPTFLQVAGNRRAWEVVVRALRERHDATILLHGPTGCGKTRGIAECARRTLGMSVYELNPAVVRSTEAFVRDIEQVASTRTLLGSRIVLVDDLEGFDETYISCFVNILKQRTASHGPLVITCTNPFDRALVGLRALEMTRVRLYPPTAKQMAEAWKTLRSDLPPITLERQATQCVGNFHQLALVLRTYCDSRPDAHVDLFETTQRRLANKATVEDWSRAAEPHILTAVLHENYCALAERGPVATALERAEAFVCTLSDGAVIGGEAALEVVGRAAGLVLHTTNPPPLRLTKQLKHAERVDLDMPRLLSESQKA